MSDWKLISTANPSGAANTSFTDLTGYKIFKFVFIDVNPATDAVQFMFQTSTDGGSSYGVTTTSTYFQAYHEETGGSSALTYLTAQDLAQSTSYQHLNNTLGNAADECAVGELYLFNPSSTTYVKHYFATMNGYDGSSGGSNYTQNNYIGGYFNTTTALNAIDFKMSSGNLDAVIKQYGLVAG
jgi:hypothetical protein